MTVDVLVVVVTYNSAEYIDDLLDGLPAAASGLSYEVTVVDNDSSDDTAARVSRREHVRLLRQPNRGYAGGINAGVDASGASSAVLVLNPDVRLEPGSMAHMLEALRPPGVGIVVPKMLNPEGQLVWSLRREPTLLRALGLGRLGHPLVSEYVQEPSAYDHRHVVTWAVGAVMMVDRRVHEDLGGWDDSYFLYSEEVDLCLRASDAGQGTVFEPAAEVTHVGGGSGRSPKTHAMQVLNRVRMYSRRHSSALSWLYWLATIASEVSWVARGHRESRAAILCLVVPSARPRELGLAPGLLPR